MSRFNKYSMIRFDANEKTGVRCWGLMRRIAREEAFYQLPEYPEVGTWDGMLIRETIDRERRLPTWTLIAQAPSDGFIGTTGARMADLVLMKGKYFDKRKRQWLFGTIHIGMVTDVAGHMIHIERETLYPVCVPLTDQTVHYRIEAIYRHRGFLHETAQAA